MNNNVNPISLGKFLIVHLTGGSYWDIYIDGRFCFTVYKDYFMPELTDSDNVEKWEMETGLKKTDFRYTQIDLEAHFSGADYDSNDYMEDYALVMSLNIKPDFVDIDWATLRKTCF